MHTTSVGERIRSLGEGGVLVSVTFLLMAGVISLAHLLGITNPPSGADTGVSHIVAGSLSFGSLSVVLAGVTRYRKLARFLLQVTLNRKTL